MESVASATTSKTYLFLSPNQNSGAVFVFSQNSQLISQTFRHSVGLCELQLQYLRILYILWLFVWMFLLLPSLRSKVLLELNDVLVSETHGQKSHSCCEKQERSSCNSRNQRICPHRRLLPSDSSSTFIDPSLTPTLISDNARNTLYTTWLASRIRSVCLRLCICGIQRLSFGS